MSVLAHYRDRLRGWGSQDMSFSTPPPLSYSPKPHWGGLHHYMAHASAVEPNPEVYEMAMERAESGALGVGLHEARHFHRHAYGGLMDLNRLSPAELGHAAAYEAFRYLLHHEPLYEPLEDEEEREREVLVSLAIAEATKLWAEASRFNDEYGLQTACSSAAATASLLHSQKRDIAEIGPDYLTQRKASRPYGDTYAEDDAALCRRAGVAEPTRGRVYGRNVYGGSSYGGRSGRALSEGPPYGRDHGGDYRMGGVGMAGSEDPRGLASPMGRMEGPTYPSSTGMLGSPMPVGLTGSVSMGGAPYPGGMVGSSMGDPRYAGSAGRSPYPSDPSYGSGAGGFVPSVQRSGSPIPNDTLGASRYQPPANQTGYNGSTMPPQSAYSGAPQSLYGGAPGAMSQPSYAGNGVPGTMPQANYGGAAGMPGTMSQTAYTGMPSAVPQMPVNGMVGAMPQAGYGGAPSVGALPGATPTAMHSGAAQPMSTGMPGVVPQGPYGAAHAALVAHPGAQVYPPGSTIVLPSRKKRHRRRARSRDLAERDRYYRERRYGDGYESY